jgi:hypothetical protein
VSDHDFITQLMFQSIATSFSAHSVAKGGLYTLAVKTPELEALAREKFRASMEAMREYAASVDGLVDWTYLNYADISQVSSSCTSCN